MPDFEIEKTHPGIVCGLDEVGRAPLAGPVVAACVYIPPENRDLPLWQHVRDSKTLSARKREALAKDIKTHSIWGIGEACPREIETQNILQASFTAMKRAYESAKINATLALIDGHITPKAFPCLTKPVIKGDNLSVSIAAASIIAKVYRDTMMAELAQTNPFYGWERNAGYPTREHLDGIEKHGITTHHRRNFAPVQNYIQWGQTKLQMGMAV